MCGWLLAPRAPKLRIQSQGANVGQFYYVYYAGHEKNERCFGIKEGHTRFGFI